MDWSAVSRFFSEVSELTGYHDLVLARRGAGWSRRIGRLLVYLAIPLGLGAAVWYNLTYAQGQLFPGGQPLPAALSVAGAGTALAFAGWLTVPRPDPTPVAAEGESAQIFYATHGWSPLVKYTAWVYSGFKPWAQIWAVVGAELLLYHLIAPVFEVPSLAATLELSGPFTQAAAGTVLFLAGWLFVLVYFFAFHLLRTGLEVYLESVRMRMFFVVSVTAYVLLAGLIYLANAGSGEIDESLMAAATSGGHFPVGAFPEITFLFGAAALLVWQMRTGNLRAILVRSAIWLLPVWSLVAVVGAFALQFLGTDPEAFGFLFAEPLLLSALVLMVANPLEPLFVVLLGNDPMLIHGLGPALYQPFNELNTPEPQLWASLEIFLIVNALVWTTALFLHGYYGFYNRCYARHLWDSADS